MWIDLSSGEKCLWLVNLDHVLIISGPDNDGQYTMVDTRGEKMYIWENEFEAIVSLLTAAQGSMRHVQRQG